MGLSKTSILLLLLVLLGPVHSAKTLRSGTRRLGGKKGKKGKKKSGGGGGGDRTPPSPTGSPPIGVAPAASPVAASTPGAPVGTSPGLNSGQYPGCNLLWLGNGMGVKPLGDIPNLPPGMSNGECLELSHCAGTQACCLKDYCLCGPPNAERSNCRGE